MREPVDPLLIMETELDYASNFIANVPEGFDEELYRRAFPEVLRAIGRHRFSSGLQHYIEYGESERRLEDPRYLKLLEDAGSSNFPASSIDAVFESLAGYVLVIGWMNDQAGSKILISVMRDGAAAASTTLAARCRREDAEGAIGGEFGRLLGFWTVIKVDASWQTGQIAALEIAINDTKRRFNISPHVVTQDRMRELILEYLSTARYFSNPVIESCLQLDHGIGQAVIDLNARISRTVITGADIERFGPQHKKFTASIIVCLYGKTEFLFLQAAAFATAPTSADYEFIYVSNSPELAEPLMKEAELAHKIYGLAITLVILPGNAGFGAANNIAAEAARSNRILIVNPDVFPRDDDWAHQLTTIIKDLPPSQTKIFGVPLFYDDGSLMHGGMFFESDKGRSMRPTGVEKRDMLRVEHYGKGAPPGTSRFTAARPVPAVTGAFISIDRAWFETLGGFSLEYVFGHYEDADLCLRSLAAGTPVWLQNIPFWHLEGKGSTRRPIHEAGSTVNRWHFTKTWGAFVADGLLGPTPEKMVAP